MILSCIIECDRHMEKLLSLEKTVDNLLLRLQETRYETIDPLLYKALIFESDSLFRKIQMHKKDLRFARCMAKAISAKLGGEIPFTLFLDPAFREFRQFIEVNALHHKMQTLKLAMPVDTEGAPLIAIFSEEKKSYFIPWNSLNRVPIEEGGKIAYYSFRYFNIEAFRTDPHFKLTSDYVLTFRGITAYHLKQKEEIIPFDKKNPSEWGQKYVLEIWTLIADREGERPTLGIGDHCHIILKDKEGFMYSMGKFGSGAKLHFKDYFTLFAKGKGRFISPDFISYYSEMTRNLKKTEIFLDEEQFCQIYRLLIEHKKEKNPLFSVLKNNCASYVANLLRSALKLNVKVEMFLLHYLLRAMLPKMVYTKLASFGRMCAKICPPSLKKAAYFVPIIYLPIVFLGASIFIMSGASKKRADYAMENIFLRPWTVTIDHPLALRESLFYAMLGKNENSKTLI